MNNEIQLTDAIAAPLVAAVEANQMASLEQIRCFHDAGFSGEKDTWTVKNIRLLVSPIRAINADEKKIIEPVTIEIPLITLFPLNCISLSDISYGFDFDVINYNIANNAAQKRTGAEYQGTTSTPRLSGKIAARPAKGTTIQAVDGNHPTGTIYSIEVVATTIPISLGMATIINALNNNTGVSSSL